MLPKEYLSSDKLVQSLQSLWVHVFLLAMNRCSIVRDQTSSQSENRNMLLTPALLLQGNFVHFSKKCECNYHLFHLGKKRWTQAIPPQRASNHFIELRKNRSCKLKSCVGRLMCQISSLAAPHPHLTPPSSQRSSRLYLAARESPRCQEPIC